MSFINAVTGQHFLTFLLLEALLGIFQLGVSDSEIQCNYNVNFNELSASKMQALIFNTLNRASTLKKTTQSDRRIFLVSAGLLSLPEIKAGFAT